MKKENFPEEIQPYLIPGHPGCLTYRCLRCHKEYGIEETIGENNGPAEGVSWDEKA